MPSYSAKKGVSVTLSGANKLRRNFDLLELGVKARAVAAINKNSLALMNEAKRECPVDMGALRSSIRPTFYNMGLAAEVSTNVGYGAFVEFGTGPLGRSTYPGDVPGDYVYGSTGHFPPLKRIREWCERVRINPKFAFVIARRIAKNGLKARSYMWVALETVRPQYEADIKNIVPKGGF